jgi:hypothetical protein
VDREMNSASNADMARLIRALEVLNDDTDKPPPAITAEEMAEHRELVLARLRQTLAERDQPQPASTPLPSTNARSSLRRGAWFLATAVGAATYGVLGALLTSSSQRGLIILTLFVIVPVLLVFWWHLEARDREVTRQSALLDSRAEELRQLHKRIRLVTRTVFAERRLCGGRGLEAATAKLDFLERQLRDAGNSARTLVNLVADGSEKARRFAEMYQRFAETCQRDLYRACSEYDQLPLTIDPKRIGAAIDNLMQVLRLTGDVAVDIPLHIAIESRGPETSSARAGEIASELESIFREVQNSSRFLKTECRRTLRAFDTLHRLVTTILIKKIARDPASRVAARAAVAASVLSQPLARRPARRTAFLREAPVSGSSSWVWIGKASMAAMARDRKSA